MSRGSALALLAVLGAGVFLAGLELMITAVALPTIITDLVVANPDRPGQTAFSELRRASWIVNGYLLAYVVAMPLAGRLADVWGARRLFLGALVVFVVGSVVAGRGQTIDDLVERLFGGETLPLVKHLIEDRGISAADLAELRKLIDRLEKGK